MTTGNPVHDFQLSASQQETMRDIETRNAESERQQAATAAASGTPTEGITPSSSQNDVEQALLQGADPQALLAQGVESDRLDKAIQQVNASVVGAEEGTRQASPEEYRRNLDFAENAAPTIPTTPVDNRQDVALSQIAEYRDSDGQYNLVQAIADGVNLGVIHDAGFTAVQVEAARNAGEAATAARQADLTRYRADVQAAAAKNQERREAKEANEGPTPTPRATAEPSPARPEPTLTSEPIDRATLKSDRYIVVPDPLGVPDTKLGEVGTLAPAATFYQDPATGEVYEVGARGAPVSVGVFAPQYDAKAIGKALEVYGPPAISGPLILADKDSPAWLKAVVVGTALVSAAGVVGVAAGKVRSGATRPQALRSALKEETLAEFGITAIESPKATAANTLSSAETALRPSKVPLASLELNAHTFKVPLKETATVGLSAAETMAIRDALVLGGKDSATLKTAELVIDKSAAGSKTEVTLFHSTGNVDAFRDGFTVVKNPEGKGELEQGLFVAPTAHTAFGSNGENPGILIFRGEKTTAVPGAVPSGKIYARGVEMEAKLPVGLKVERPVQVLVTRDTAGRTLPVLVFGKPYSAAEVARLKLLAPKETVRGIFTKQAGVRSLAQEQKATEVGIERAINASKAAGRPADEVKALEGRLAAVRRSVGRDRDVAEFRPGLVVIGARLSEERGRGTKNGEQRRDAEGRATSSQRATTAPRQAAQRSARGRFDLGDTGTRARGEGGPGVPGRRDPNLGDRALPRGVVVERRDGGRTDIPQEPSRLQTRSGDDPRASENRDLGGRQDEPGRGDDPRGDVPGREDKPGEAGGPGTARGGVAAGEGAEAKTDGGGKVYPRKVKFVQGIFETTVDLTNGARKYKRVDDPPGYTDPRTTLRVLEYSKDKPKFRVTFNQGVADVGVDPSNLGYERASRNPLPKRRLRGRM